MWLKDVAAVDVIRSWRIRQFKMKSWIKELRKKNHRRNSNQLKYARMRQTKMQCQLKLLNRSPEKAWHIKNRTRKKWQKIKSYEKFVLQFNQIEWMFSKNFNWIFRFFSVFSSFSFGFGLFVLSVVLGFSFISLLTGFIQSICCFLFLLKRHLHWLPSPLFCRLHFRK